MKEVKRIAVIGTRDINEEGILKIAGFVKDTYGEDIILHSGNADGVDQVVSYFAKANIFIPWATYNSQHRTKGHYIVDKGTDTLWDTKTIGIAPHFPNLKQGVQKLLRRNAFIILGDGDRIPPVDLVIWYTGRGVAGGTAYGVKMARANNIRDFEITKDHLDKLPPRRLEKYKKPLTGIQALL